MKKRKEKKRKEKKRKEIEQRRSKKTLKTMTEHIKKGGKSVFTCNRRRDHLQEVQPR
jgi:hypothetical protein